MFEYVFYKVWIISLIVIFAVKCKANSEMQAEITKYRVAPTDENGVFKYAYATSNGIDVQAAGSPIESIGIYSYISPEGVPIEVRYIADELGFHAVGRHLPRPPPIPDYILRSLEYIKKHAPPQKF
ncbi:pupal cuticle protein Edg-78E [Lucilia cuprina]|uniref:pupal cuticle protein Edg-78E n=1 Tax=Lucilia cuprina TaxID=7375 RepID=UPI001F05B581|nr:pupal cuticle protein Edg-78E [Lucilia cuprina]